MKISIVINKQGKTTEESKPYAIVGPVPDYVYVLNETFIPGIVECHHSNTTAIEWPDGGSVEICDCCLMSRHHWEQGQTSWIMIDDVYQALRDTQEAIDNFIGDK